VNGIDVQAKGVRRPRWAAGFSSFLRGALGEMRVRNWEVSVLLCNDAVMKDLNRRYRGRNESTDVLSFRQADGGTQGHAGTAGDIVISLDTLRRNAAAMGVSEEEELKRLGVHGLLHLAGMDHGPGKGGAMLALQERIVERLAGARIGAGRSRR